MHLRISKKWKSDVPHCIIESARTCFRTNYLELMWDTFCGSKSKGDVEYDGYGGGHTKALVPQPPCSSCFSLNRPAPSPCLHVFLVFTPPRLLYRHCPMLPLSVAVLMSRFVPNFVFRFMAPFLCVFFCVSLFLPPFSFVPCFFCPISFVP